MKFLEMPGNLSGIRYENMCQKFKFKDQILNPFHSFSFPEICIVWISMLLKCKRDTRTEKQPLTELNRNFRETATIINFLPIETTLL